jgi:hypothetical protein
LKQPRTNNNKQEEKAMIISDLNYLESVEEEIYGGGIVTLGGNFTVNKNVNASVTERFNKSFNISTGGVTGNTAELIGTADAQGNNTFTSIIGGTQTTSNSSESFLQAVSVTA